MLKSMVEKNIHFSPDICGKTDKRRNEGVYNEEQNTD